MTKTKYRVLEIIDYIEESLGAPLSLNEISKRFQLSQYHLHRVFSSLTGLPIMSYIRGRKLAKSLEYLTFKNFKIIDIALLSGFSYEQAFIRAFKQEFKLTPNKYRKNPKPLSITKKVDIEDIKLIQNGVFLPPEIVFFSNLNLLTHPYIVNEDDSDYKNRAKNISINFHTNMLKSVKGSLNRETLYGIFEPINSEYSSYKYYPAVSYNALESIPNELEKRILKPGKYIIFKYIGNHSINDINADFIKGSYDYVHKNYNEYMDRHWSRDFKIERIEMSINRSDYCELDMFYPVKQLL